jgi:membrane-associated HD superfamily phosphohydrolase
MGLRAYLSSIGLGTVLAWFGWAMIILNITPREASTPGFVMFYLTLAVALVGTLTFIFSIFRVYVLRRSVIEREIRTSFRHAILCSLITIVSLVLSSAGRFSVWYSLLLLAIASVIEYLFLQAHHGRG